MKCRRCKAPAVIDVRRHNAAFCRDCFLHHCREQVRRAIDDFDMIGPGERVLVAVSGGKDSLGLWHLLRALDYEADHIDTEHGYHVKSIVDTGISEFELIKKAA